MPWLRRVWTTAVEGLRALVFFRVRPERVDGSLLTIATLTVLIMLVHVGPFVFDGGQLGQLNGAGINSFVAAAAATALLAALLARERHGISVASFVSVMQAAALWIFLLSWAVVASVYGLIDGIDRRTSLAIYFGTLIFANVAMAFAGWRSGRAMSTGPTSFAARAMLAALVGPLIISQQSLTTGMAKRHVDASLWGAPSLVRLAQSGSTATTAGTAGPQRRQRDSEEILALQPKLLTAALSKLRPPEGRPTLYFVAAGTYDSQDVFMREVDQARAIADERLGTAGRSVVLVNNEETMDRLPLATLGNLRTVLTRVGKLMNAERDALMLYVTSHGSPGRIVVEMENLALRNITPKALKGILDEAKIRHRIIILSACFSGSFIEALKDDHTLIATAARPDRTSFGCSHEREWTYFGDALFNHALRNTRSILGALEMARFQVGEWELRQRLTPSEPQLYVGPGMREYLERTGW